MNSSPRNPSGLRPGGDDYSVQQPASTGPKHRLPPHIRILPIVEVEPLPAPPRFPFWSGLFTFPLYPQSLLAWMKLAFAVTFAWLTLLCSAWYLSNIGPHVTVGSLRMGSDIATSDPFEDSDDPDAPDLTAIAGAHRDGLEKMLEDFEDLVAMKVEKLHTDLGDARRSEITYSGSLGSTVRGYFASIRGHGQLVTVICTCPEDNWETLKPAFAKAIETMAPGRDERYGP